VDVGVNIDMTPTVHLDREVSLKMKIEISSQTGTSTIDGVAEPIISQRVVQQVIQLKDGEPSILAGLLQQSDTKSVSGTPGLGELPFLKYFFSSQQKVQQTDEIVFLLIPHIVRESLLSDTNTRVVDSGTSQGIELRRSDPSKRIADADDPAADSLAGAAPSLQQTSAANAASAMLGQIAAQAQPLTTSGSLASTAPLKFSVLPATMHQETGATFQVAVMVSDARDLSSVPLQVQFDPKVLALVNVEPGDLLGRDGQAAALTRRDEGNGIVAISGARPPHTIGVSGQGTIFTLTFKAIARGDSPLSLIKIGATDSKQVRLPTVGSQAVVHVK
jgi:general secretion pathway protein D